MAHARRHTGMSLIEVMISMTILLVGMLGLMNLQIWGLNSNQGARAQMIATELAREMAAAIDQLPFDDPRLAPTARWGSLVNWSGAPGVVAGGYTPFTPLPGVRGDEVIERDLEGCAVCAGRPVYQRNWTVKVTDRAGGQDAVKIVAISVVYHERGIHAPREVVLYVPKVKVGLLTVNLGS